MRFFLTIILFLLPVSVASSDNQTGLTDNQVRQHVVVLNFADLDPLRSPLLESFVANGEESNRVRAQRCYMIAIVANAYSEDGPVLSSVEHLGYKFYDDFESDVEIIESYYKEKLVNMEINPETLEPADQEAFLSIRELVLNGSDKHMNLFLSSAKKNMPHCVGIAKEDLS